MDWEAVGFVKASNIRAEVLRKLAARPMSPKELKDELSLHFSQVSLVLREMRDMKLVTCLTVERSKGKIYGITDLGKQVLQRL